MTTPLAMTCADVDVALDAYLSGAMDDARAAAVETHVAGCARCEAMLEQATRLDVSAFAPAMPDDLKARTLAAVAERPRAATSAAVTRAGRTWRMWSAVAACAAVVTVAVLRSTPATPETVVDSVASAATVPEIDETMPQATMLRGARSMAQQQAASEFESLDAAAREIDAALEAAPDDREMRAYRDAIRARRAELADKIAEAAS